jgi:alginate O-acetyltransferase complex protein AlgI
MVFNSLQFLIFFIIITVIYFLLKRRGRVYMLLAASCYFYMAFIPVYILILATTILIDYFAGIYIERSTGNRRKYFLLISIISTCLVLFIFKYYNFFLGTANDIFSLFHIGYLFKFAGIILPIGLSFHTFQSLSYVIEVYKGKQKAETNFGVYSLYVMFYPQLVAGPIERPQNLLHQFYEEHGFDYNRVTDGLKQMAWGLFKKVVIADRLSILVGNVYNQPTQFHGWPLIIATYFFTFQIYCDFSGYSDIAIGAAKVMGFKLMDNFRRPYFSESVPEFWRRWHISLSTWFRDYVYIPLGGNRSSSARQILNILIVFVVSGLWHGANWTFVIWGALHGVFVTVSSFTSKLWNKTFKKFSLTKNSFVWRFTKILITFHLVTFAWIFFRANNLNDAWYIVSHLFSGASLKQLAQTNKLGLDWYGLNVALIGILLLSLVNILEIKGNMWQSLKQKPIWLRWGIYYSMSMAIIVWGVFGEQRFIYFQF